MTDNPYWVGKKNKQQKHTNKIQTKPDSEVRFSSVLVCCFLGNLCFCQDTHQRDVDWQKLVIASQIVGVSFCWKETAGYFLSERDQSTSVVVILIAVAVFLSPLQKVFVVTSEQFPLHKQT